MKKLYLLIAITGITNNLFAQFAVSAIAASPTVCLGSSTTLTATAAPISYTATLITYNLLPSQGTNVLCSAGALDPVDPIPPAANPNGVLFLNDSRWDNISLPFNFTYFGNIYSQVNICTNGWIGLGATNAGLTGFNVTVPNAIAANNVIFGMLSNLTFQGGTGGTIEYFIDGVAPNRKFVVLYSDIHFTSGGGTGDLEIILCEGTNTVEVHNSVITNTTLNKTQGIENIAGTVGVATPGKNNIANWGVSASAYRFAPETITYTWSPSTGLSSTSGQSVTATPLNTTTYTITAVNSVLTSANNTVTVTVDPASETLAGIAGGSSISHNINVNPGGTYYRDISNCNLISFINPTGASPVSNSINNTIKVDAGATKRGTSDLYLARKYDIEPILNPATSTATITLYFLQTEFNDFNTKASDSAHTALPTGPSDNAGKNNLILRQFHGTGTNPTNYTGSVQDFTTASPGVTVNWNAGRNRWEITIPVTGFSGFYITSKKIAPTPITMEYFKGVQINNQHRLTWKYTCTSTQAKFELERSTDAIHYTIINSITATQARCQSPFEYLDQSPMGGINYYRLKAIDVDGKFSYSNIITLVLKTKGYTVLGLNPNPIHNENAFLNINSGGREEISILITDLSGRVIYKQAIQLHPGINQYPVNTLRLANGSYQLTIYSPGENPQTIKFIKL